MMIAFNCNRKTFVFNIKTDLNCLFKLLC